ncbi:MAG: hypothetical protein GC179_27250 [Anaerolineaceae bacterium]|nr:hypothetical protein [Anaerolineaceae bacterium]
MTPKVIYFKSAICPRCRATDRRLSELQTAHPEVEIETVEILTDPARVLREGIWMNSLYHHWGTALVSCAVYF